jgi:hypothetical protein
MIDYRIGCHFVGFWRWLLAVDYYGYFYCNKCHKKVQISKKTKNKYHIICLLSSFVFAISTVLTTEFENSFWIIIGFLIGMAVFFVLSRILWKENCDISI